MNKKPQISFYTLGCKLNQAETAALKNAAKEKGYNIVPFSDVSDIMVVNSCTVTGRADRKTRQALYQARRRSPEGILVLLGCYPQVNPKQSTLISDVDIVLGTHDKFDVFSAIDTFMETGEQYAFISPVDNNTRPDSTFIAATERTRAFLKVQEGCDNFCTFCIVPYARGNPVSRNFQDTLTEARRLVDAGYREIVLSGIDIGAYKDEDKDLLELIRALEDIKGLDRIRISSIEMNTLHDALIRYIGSSEKVMPHFHLSLQSGSDTILRAMGRKYLCEDFTRKVETIRKYIPGASIGTDVIVGFPGESDALFIETMGYINKIAFSYLHIFRYSARKGTPAATMKDPVSENRKKERASLLNDTDRLLREKFAAGFYGTRQPVLWENFEDGMLYGHTPHYLQVRIPGQVKRKNTVSEIMLERDNILL
ncbi:MAG: tRNA (N(6)-L-threonylcarbamoyladenosine(37)-C(2))-methylthiotransferase MtaB [Fidelibacterota bacterium]